jgi:HK97 gp10 family phage protein
MAVANSIQDEINDLVRKIRAISDSAKKDSQKAFKIAAKPLIEEIQRRAPVSDEPHKRYLSGQVVATYYPGNLKRSIKTLIFRRSAAVFVGPKMSQDSKGEFRSSKTDGYYAHLLEFEYGLGGKLPQPFIRPGAAAAGPATLRIAVRELKNTIDNYARRYEK